MKQTIIALVLLLSVALAGCGGTNGATGNINGSWFATLNGSTSEALSFDVGLTVNADGSLGSSNFSFTVNNTSCTFPTVTESGSFMLTGNFNGQVSGKLHYVVTLTGAEVNTLTLDGTVSGGTINGTWSVSGATAGCSGTGNFVMTPSGVGG
jgi:hypothetical protein